MAAWRCCFTEVTVLVLLFAVAKAADYHGKIIGTLSNLANHNVKGAVYAVDNKRIRIVNFHYDGTAPDAFFWVGTTSAPSTKGTIVPDENGSTKKLKKYDGKTLTLTLPGGLQVGEGIKWLSVWCKAHKVNFGHVTFPEDLKVPAPKDLGSFTSTRYDVEGTVTIQDSRTFLISNFFYNGNGPDAFFWVGKGYTPKTDGTQIPDENGASSKLKAYDNKNITIRLPDGTTVFDIGYLSVWCKGAGSSFGVVTISKTPALNIPPYIGATKTGMMNCESLHDKLNVGWEINSTHITLELSGVIADGDYMAFGPSGSASSTSMFNADVTVAFLDNSKPEAVDYKISAYSPCTNGNGACPDVRAGAHDDVTAVSGQKTGVITKIKFIRMLDTGDAADKLIPRDNETYVAWAIGKLSSDKLVTKHYLRTEGNKKINFGRQATKNCPALTTGESKSVTPWPQLKLSGARSQTFRARIGASGGKRGYTGITGKVGWGLCWYINDLIIPEIEVKRGVTYTFAVEGGQDTTNLAKYHPLYITNDPDGGYYQKSQAERKKVTVYAGLDANGNLSANATGHLCQYKRKSSDQSKEEPATFAQYFKTLELKCQKGKAGQFTWTPDKNTPNLVYYQCFTHRNLGWKIRVVDEYSPVSASGKISASFSFVSHVIFLLYLFIDKC